MSTYDAMSDADYAACVDAGRGPGRDVRDEADQLRKANREQGYPVWDGAGACVICHRPTVGSVRGESMCGDCERQMADELRED